MKTSIPVVIADSSVLTIRDKEMLVDICCDANQIYWFKMAEVINRIRHDMANAGVREYWAKDGYFENKTDWWKQLCHPMSSVHALISFPEMELELESARKEHDRVWKLYQRYDRQYQSKCSAGVQPAAKLKRTVVTLKELGYNTARAVSQAEDRLVMARAAVMDARIKQLRAEGVKGVWLAGADVGLLSCIYGVRTYYATFGQTSAGEHSSSCVRSERWTPPRPQYVDLTADIHIIDEGYGCNRLIWDLEARAAEIAAPAEVSYNADNLAYQNYLMHG